MVPDKVDEPGKWTIQVSATGERGLKNRATVAVLNGEGAANGIAVEFSKLWATEGMKQALKVSKTLQVVFKVSSKDGKKHFIKRIPVELSDHILTVKCSKAEVSVTGGRRRTHVV